MKINESESGSVGRVGKVSENEVSFIGRIGANPVVRTKRDGTLVCTFSLATSRPYRPDREQEETDWHQIVVFHPETIERIRTIGKGSLLRVKGSARNSKLEPKPGEETQRAVVRTEYYANKVLIIEKRQSLQEGQADVVTEEEGIASDDIAF